jgi:hypothetical protein
VLQVNEAQNGCRLSDLAEKVTPILLETSEACLLAQQIQVRVDEDWLFVLSGQEIYLFNTDGVFLKQLVAKKDGPEGFIVNGFTLNTDKKELVIWTPQQVVYFFTYDGLLLRKQSLDDDKQSLTIAYLHNAYWVKSQTLREDNGAMIVDKWLLKYNSAFEKTDSVYLLSYEGDHAFMSYDYSDEISIVGKKQYIHAPTTKRDRIVRDTLYLLEDGALKPALQINYGHLSYQETGHPMMIGYPINLSPVQVSSRFLFSSYHEFTNERRGYGLYIYDKTREQDYWAKDGIEDDLYQTAHITRIESLDVSNESFYYYSNDENLTTFFPEREIDDNPVVFLVHLKK